jgi:hypothetical protein
MRSWLRTGKESGRPWALVGKDVYAEDGCAPLILMKIYLVYDKYVRQESVFPLKMELQE